MADDLDFESFEQLDDLDWSELEKGGEQAAGGGEAEGGAKAEPGSPGSAAADAMAAKVASSDKFVDINYLLDVSLHIMVEVGRKQAYIHQILGYDHGSVVELEKLVGEPLDLLVNNKRVARGEVVVVNEKFAIKITEILDPNDRLSQLMF
ncbi:MAG: flagellar motor switch protein FliN [SAR324 cluster bacterium]|nr:flagellar motor switch protein FliN [SAR324 cluster bacterium]